MSAHGRWVRWVRRVDEMISGAVGHGPVDALRETPLGLAVEMEAHTDDPRRDENESLCQYLKVANPVRWTFRKIATCGAALALAGCASTGGSAARAEHGLGSFYATPSSLTGGPGALVRSAPLTTPAGDLVRVAGARAIRLLYATRDSSGRDRVSGAMAFIPVGRAPRGGRPVVAWAHPTRSPENIAPSSSPDPLRGMEPWLHSMVRRGWIVVATDYTGLGTLGPQHYLDGAEEAGDIVDSVLAVHHVVGAAASRHWVAWGASYGGHAALWTASQAGVLAPELRLDGVAAAAPVADLVELEHAQGQAWASEVAKQDPPPQAGVPILIVQGTRDAVVPAANTEKVKVSWCASGVDVTLAIFPGATHESVVPRASQTVVAWVADRFDGRPVLSGC